MVETKEHQIKRGKQSRAQGGAFEKRVRADLEEKGWIVDKWSNNVEFDKNEATMNPEHSISKGIVRKEFDGGQWIKKITYGKLVPAKPKYLFINGSMRMVGNSSGFPDFIAIRNVDLTSFGTKFEVKEVIGVESKMTGDLDREEKEKCKWLLDNKIFSKILIAEKTKVNNRVVIVYHDFKEKYWRFYK